MIGELTMTLFLSRTVLLGGAMSLAFGAVALAAPKPSPAPSPEAGKKGEGRMMMMHREHGPMAMHHRRDPEAHARHLRDILQLTPAQEPALKAFLEAAKSAMRAERRDQAAPGAAPLTTPQRLDRQLARMAERQDAFARRAAATKAFYAQLTPSQQKAFDALHQGRGGMHGARVRMHRSGPGGQPMAFGPEGDDVLVGDLAALDDFELDLDLGGFDLPPPPEPPEPPEPPHSPEG